MGTASSKARDQQQRRRAQGIAVAQAEKRLEAGRRSPPGSVHRSIAPGTLSPIKTARSKSSKPLAMRASEAMGCSGRKAAKKKASLLPRPSSAGGLAVEVGGKQFVQAGEVRRREALALEAAARAKRDEEEDEQGAGESAGRTEAKLEDNASDERAERAERQRLVEELGLELPPTPHSRPCVNDPASLRRPTPLAARSQKEDEDRDSTSVVELVPRSLAPRRLGPLAPLAGQQVRGGPSPRLGARKMPAPRGRRHQPPQPQAASPTPPGGIPLVPGDRSQGFAPPTPSLGWAQPAQQSAR
jgi:hypothetical protein